MPRRILTAVLLLALASAAHAGAAPEHTWTETGYGRTKEDARQRAVEDGRVLVQDYLDRNFPNLGWSPTSDYLVRIGAVRVDEPRETDLKDLGRAYEAVAHVDLGEPRLREMQEQVDEARRKAEEPVVSQRHFLVGRVLAALVALLLVAAGYLRLEELTRGYYTTLLRVGAGALLLLTVLGLALVG